LKKLKKISWAEPSIGIKEKNAIEKVLRSGWLTQGSITENFEKKISKIIGCKHAIVTNNGTSSLICSLLAHEICPGDEVIVPSFTFVATVNAVLSIGAKPVLVDCDPETFNTDINFIEKKITKKTRAILPVDVSGMPIDIEAFKELSTKKNLILIQDSAEGIGAKYKNKNIGSFGHSTIFSFHMAKVVAGIEGGCIVTNDSEIAKKAKLIRSHGDAGQYFHKIFGLNFRISDLHAAFALSQLKQMKKFLKHRQIIAKIYKDELHKLEFQHIPKYVTLHPYMLFAVLTSSQQRNYLRQFLSKNGVDTRVCWPPVHMQPFHSNLFRNQKLPNSEKIFSQIINLPMGNGLSEKDALFVTTLLKKGLKSI